MCRNKGHPLHLGTTLATHTCGEIAISQVIFLRSVPDPFLAFAGLCEGRVGCHSPITLINNRICHPPLAALVDKASISALTLPLCGLVLTSFLWSLLD